MSLRSHAYARLAWFHRFFGKRGASDRYALKAISIDPQCAFAWHIHAGNLTDRDDKESEARALHAKRMAHAADPTCCTYAMTLATFLAYLGRIEEARGVADGFSTNDRALADKIRERISGYGKTPDALSEMEWSELDWAIRRVPLREPVQETPLPSSLPVPIPIRDRAKSLLHAWASVICHAVGCDAASESCAAKSIEFNPGNAVAWDMRANLLMPSLRPDVLDDARDLRILQARRMAYQCQPRTYSYASRLAIFLSYCGALEGARGIADAYMEINPRKGRQIHSAISDYEKTWKERDAMLQQSRDSGGALQGGGEPGGDAFPAD